MTYKITLVDAGPVDNIEFHRLLAQLAPRLDQRWEASDFAEADLVVVDIDSVSGHMSWLKVHGAGKRAAAFTKLAAPVDSDLVLRKPLSGSNLAALLAAFAADAPPPAASVPTATPPVPATPPSRVATNVIAEPVRAPGGTTPPVAPPRRKPEPVPIAGPAPPPEPPPRDARLADYLTGTLLSGPARLSSDNAPDLVLDPKNQMFHVTGNGLRALAPHCVRKLKATDWPMLAPAELDKLRSATPGQPYSRLLWFCTLTLSEGRLLPELDSNARYKLARWPQIEREFPKHFRIATVMLKQLATPSEIADGASSSLPDVIDFINAYHAIGFVENDMAKPVDPVETARGGMLSRLRNPFGR